MKFTDHKNQEALFNTCEELTIPTKAAIPLGLIVNEIATNAMKYGFTRDEEAQFTVELINNEETAHYFRILATLFRRGLVCKGHCRITRKPIQTYPELGDAAVLLATVRSLVVLSQEPPRIMRLPVSAPR